MSPGLESFADGWTATAVHRDRADILDQGHGLPGSRLRSGSRDGLRAFSHPVEHRPSDGPQGPYQLCQLCGLRCQVSPSRAAFCDRGHLRACLCSRFLVGSGAVDSVLVNEAGLMQTDLPDNG